MLLCYRVWLPAPLCQIKQHRNKLGFLICSILGNNATKSIEITIQTWVFCCLPPAWERSRMRLALLSGTGIQSTARRVCTLTASVEEWKFIAKINTYRGTVRLWNTKRWKMSVASKQGKQHFCNKSGVVFFVYLGSL